MNAALLVDGPRRAERCLCPVPSGTETSDSSQRGGCRQCFNYGAKYPPAPGRGLAAALASLQWRPERPRRARSSSGGTAPAGPRRDPSPYPAPRPLPLLLLPAVPCRPGGGEGPIGAAGAARGRCVFAPLPSLPPLRREPSGAGREAGGAAGKGMPGLLVLAGGKEGWRAAIAGPRPGAAPSPPPAVRPPARPLLAAASPKWRTVFPLPCLGLWVRALSPAPLPFLLWRTDGCVLVALRAALHSQKSCVPPAAFLLEKMKTCADAQL